jgi:hypothetical protein
MRKIGRPTSGQRHNKALYPTACSPFVPHFLSAAGELGRCAAAPGLNAFATIE